MGRVQLESYTEKNTKSSSSSGDVASAVGNGKLGMYCFITTVI